jgi:hypothetical protein
MTEISLSRRAVLAGASGSAATIGGLWLASNASAAQIDEAGPRRRSQAAADAFYRTLRDRDLDAFDAVPSETPAAVATSRRVGLRLRAIGVREHFMFRFETFQVSCMATG